MNPLCASANEESGPLVNNATSQRCYTRDPFGPFLSVHLPNLYFFSMPDDGPEPMELESVGAHDAKMTQSDPDTNTDTSHDEVCAITFR